MVRETRAAANNECIINGGVQCKFVVWYRETVKRFETRATAHAQAL
jgi:hypothetical protein